MQESPELEVNDWKKEFIVELERARKELILSEKAFSWVENDPEAVDAALSRIDAARKHFSYLVKKAKELGIKPDKKTVYEKLLKKYEVKLKGMQRCIPDFFKQFRDSYQTRLF